MLDLNSEQNKQSLKRLRRRCQTDLIFLATHVLGYDKVTREVHGPYADFFVKKDPAKATLEQDEEIKERLLLMPRGTYKSTLDLVDSIQWMLCDPNVTILILTGSASLADAFVGEIRGHFVHRPGVVNKLLLIFPEYGIQERDDKGSGFTVPARTRFGIKEPTVMAAGVETSTSGFHFDIIKADDCVTNRNSESATYLERTANNINLSVAMLHPGGYFDAIGTRYNPADYYGLAMEKACEEAEIQKQELDKRLLEDPGPVVVGSLKILSKPAWRHKTGKAYLDPEQLKVEEDFTLFFPTILDFKTLVKKYRKDRKSFFSQYLNDPIAASGAMITEDILRAATRPNDQIPTEGEIFCVWDLNYKNGKVNDHSACSIGRLHEGTMYWIDSIYEKYRPSEIGAVIATIAKRYNASRIDIEDCLGAQWLSTSITNELAGYPVIITWVPIDRTEGSKQARIKSIEKFLSSGKLVLSANASHLSVLYEQLVRAGFTKRDDLADSLAYLCARIPIDRVSTEGPGEDIEARIRQQALYRLIYGLDQPFTPPPPPDAPEVVVSPFDEFYESLAPGLNC